MMLNFLKSGAYLFLLTLFLCLPKQLLAQKHFEEGYVVLNNGDTIVGFVKDRTPDPFGKLYKRIRFKGEGKSKYGPDEIISYKRGDALYESIGLVDAGGFLNQDYSTTPDEKYRVFVRVIERGYVNHYYLEFQDPDSGYFDYFSYFKKNNGTELVRTTQGLFGLKRKRLATFFSDCSILVDKILNKELRSANEVASFYNQWKRSQKMY